MQGVGENNADYWYSYVAFIKFNIRPLEYAMMSRKEKNLIYAYLDIYAEEKKKEQAKLKSGRKRR